MNPITNFTKHLSKFFALIVKNSSLMASSKANNEIELFILYGSTVTKFKYLTERKQH